MPLAQDIQTVLLSAGYKNALAVQKNYNYVQNGGLPRNEAQINYIRLNINGLQYLYNLGNYISATTTTLYDRLNTYVGFDTTANTLDPNAQIPGVTIIIEVNQPQPIDPISFSDFDASTQLPDGGRVNYFNSSWKGFNPVLSLTSPAETALRLGVDYVLIAAGGISLLNSSQVLPEIYDGMTLRSSAYVTA